MRGPKKTILALFVDGLDIKLAHLSVKGKGVAIQELRSATLASKIEERKMAEVGAMALADGTDACNLPAGSAEMGGVGTDQNNGEVLLGLLPQYPSAKYSLTYSIGEPSLYYHLLESDFGLKGKKLKARILEELRSIRAFQPSEDAVDAIPTDDDNLLCVVREDGLSLINSLEGIKGFLGGRLPRIQAAYCEP